MVVPTDLSQGAATPPDCAVLQLSYFNYFNYAILQLSQPYYKSTETTNRLNLIYARSAAHARAVLIALALI